MNIWIIGKNSMKITWKNSLFPGKEDFYSGVNMEDITDAVYAHTKRVCKDFQIKVYENIMTCMFKAIHCC